MDEETEKQEPTPLRVLVDLRQNTQKQRVAMSNRIEAVDSGRAPYNEHTYSIYQKWFQRFKTTELQVDGDIRDLAENYEIIDIMCMVKGIGPLLAAKIVALIDIHESPHVSSLWRFAGYGVSEGKADRPISGQPLVYNQRLKSMMFVIGQSLLKTRSPYAAIYYEAKEYYENNRDWSKLHRHLAAMRKMIKLYLSHLWIIWRELEGLPVNMPWILEKESNVHTHYISPQEMGWPEMEV
jgi:hypothetical protein